MLPSLDENTRRYYLDAMGIQCWQALDFKRPDDAQHVDKDAAAEHAVGEAVISERVVAESAETYINKQSRDAELITWPQIDSNIQHCEQCQLHKTRKQAIIGRGNQSAELMFILLSPSTDDDKAGVLCSGESEALLTKMLGAINIPINDVYLSSLLKCSVPLNHTVSGKEIQLCNSYLKQQIQLVKPKLLVVLGETTIQCLLQKSLSLDDYRAMNDALTIETMNNKAADNESRQQFDSIPLFVSYSPQELILHPENKRKAWSDLQLLQSVI